MNSTRRQFLKQGAMVASTVALAGTELLHANPMGQPLGFQTFEIIKDLQADWQGTWNNRIFWLCFLCNNSGNLMCWHCGRGGFGRSNGFSLLRGNSRDC